MSNTTNNNSLSKLNAMLNSTFAFEIHFESEKEGIIHFYSGGYSSLAKAKTAYRSLCGRSGSKRFAHYTHFYSGVKALRTISKRDKTLIKHV